MKNLLLASSLFVLFACQNTSSSSNVVETAVNDTHEYGIQHASGITIDGKGNDAFWNTTEWRPMDQRWIGEAYTKDDFEGRYKLAWDNKHIYVLAEIKDDTLVDTHTDGLDHYWDDDCLELFLDEDRSKGNHQFNHNAFAYHIALDGKVVDISYDSIPHYYNHHLSSARTQDGKTSTWEVALNIYDESYVDAKSTNNNIVPLNKGKKIGFAIAYCDNDHSESRENFIGSIYVEGEDKDQGWINAGIFEEMVLE